MNLTKYVQDWFRRADDDLKAAGVLLGQNVNANIICFHSQQAAEKCLKGFLAHHEKHARKIHDLEALLEECLKINSTFEVLKEDARFLNQFYVESRYPDDYIQFSSSDAEKALEAGEKIKNFIIQKIK